MKMIIVTDRLAAFYPEISDYHFSSQNSFNTNTRNIGRPATSVYYDFIVPELSRLWYACFF